MENVYIEFKNDKTGKTPLNAENLNLLQTKIKDEIKDLKLNTIQSFQNFVWTDSGNGILTYNLKGLYKPNLEKVEIGYTESSSLTVSPDYTEITEYSGYIETGITSSTTLYIWVKLTYTDLGEIEITTDADGERHTIYLDLNGLACFTGDTKILTETGMKEIKDIKINDNIVTTSGIKPVTKKYEHIVNKIYRIKVENEEIKASYSHPFMTERGIVIARDLKVGDILEDITGRKVEIKDIEIIEERAIVYEINTDSNYYYITDSKILVASEVL